jgi:8-oxo-dGTP pyrophosphatase MutT (NUDIX family)
VLLYEGRYLLVQHHNHLPETIGKWGLPGGRIETSDENLIAALRRELYEEFSMTVDVIGFVAMYSYRDRAHHIFLARPHNLDFIVDEREILSSAWYSLAEVMQVYSNGGLHTGFELAAIRASISRFGGAVAAAG